MSDEVKALLQAAREKATAAKALIMGDEPDTEQAMALLEQAETLRARADAVKRAQRIIAGVAEPELPADLPTEPEAGELPGPQDEAAVKAALNDVRFGPMDDPTSLVMREVYGTDYRQLMYEQSQAFMKYLRTGVGAPVLRQQIWAPEAVKSMLRDGVSVAEIKATMVEGADELGGYAVPPQVAAEILQRLPGLTAVRAAGARVFQTASNMVEWLKLTGGNTRYPTAMRGLWGTEVQSPTEDDWTFGLEQIPVHTYTYKVSMSQSAIEDAQNLVEIFNDLVVVTLAVDEDDACIHGDGAGKPRGLLPSDANSHSISEVISGNTSTLDVATVKGLRRGIATQYRMGGRACWLANSSTADTIEQFQDGEGRFYFDDLSIGQPFLRYRWFESEAMPDVAATAYPLLFGDFSGYMIVERLGLSVVRFQDSATGINKVEFHVRRRIGGNVIEVWKFAVQKVSAT
jgi:HK97 family phage major capsid protein